MIQLHRGEDRDGDRAVLEALAHRRRRSALRLLLSRGRLHVEELVGGVAAMERSRAGDATVDETRLRVDLRHRHLPKLADAGLVDVRDRTVCVRRAARDDPLLGDLLAVEADDWDAVLSCLSDDRRRAALATLAEREEPTDVPVLAFEVAERVERTAHPDVDALARDLHHVHLPKLADAGLVDVEDGGTSVRYLGHADLEAVASDGGVEWSRRRVTL